MAARAALVASRPWPLGGQVSSAHRTSNSTRNSVGFVLCCADPATSSSNGSNKKKKEEHVDTRIHWGNSTDGWIGDDEPAASSGQSTSSSGSSSSNGSSSSRRQRRNLNSKASIIDQAPDSHYRWAFVVRSLRLSGSSSLHSFKSFHFELLWILVSLMGGVWRIIFCILGSFLGGVVGYGSRRVCDTSRIITLDVCLGSFSCQSQCRSSLKGESNE